jgi:acyl-CoA dehydrogenase
VDEGSFVQETRREARQQRDRVGFDERIRQLHEAGQAVIGPAADDVDRQARFPAESLAALRGLSLLAACLPAELGGLNLGLSDLVEVALALAQYCGSAAMVWSMHQIQLACLDRYASAGVRAWLNSSSAMQPLVASVTSEEGTEGELRRSVAALERGSRPNRVVLRKRATAVSYGQQADAFLVTARRYPAAPPSDQVLLLAPRGMTTVRVTGGWDTLGMRGTASNAMEIEVDIPEDHVLTTDFATVAAHTMVPYAHVLWSATWLGIASDAVTRCRRGLRGRARKGRQLTAGAEMRMARADSLLRMGIAGVRMVARDLDQMYGADTDEQVVMDGIDHAVRIAGVKAASAQLSLDIVTDALHALGMVGYTEGSEFSVARQLRDVHSAPLMVSNDRIYTEAGRLSLLLSDGRPGRPHDGRTMAMDT